MKSFKFHLQSVLDIRRGREERLREELSQIQIRLSRQERLLAELLEDRERALVEAAAARTGSVQPSTLADGDLRLLALEEDIALQTDRAQMVRREFASKQSEMVKAAQETKALEKVRERREKEYVAEQMREEQKFLDEIASIRAARLQSAAAGSR